MSFPTPDISLLSYNLFCRPDPIQSKQHPDFKNQRLRDLIEFKKCVGFDILCFQEVFGGFSKSNSQRREWLINELRKEGFKYFSHSGLNHPTYAKSRSLFHISLVDGGLLTLSQFPIVESQELVFSRSALPDSLSKKGCLFTRLLLPSASSKVHSYLDVYNTHLQADEGAKQKKIRQSQLDEIIHFITRFSLSNIPHGETPPPILLCGDFNIDANVSSELDELYAFFASNNMPVVDIIGKNNPHCVTYGSGNDNALTPLDFTSIQARYDYIFFLTSHPSQKLTISSLKTGVNEMTVPERDIVPYKQLSDHFAIYATMSFS